MSYDQQEVSEYTMGSPLWAGMADPILKIGTNDSVFWDLLIQKFRGWKHLDCEQNRNTAIAVFLQKNFGQPIVCSELRDLIFKLCSIQYSGFTDPNVAPAELPDTRPRDRNGRLMSPKALQWKTWEEWANDPQTSSKQIDELKNSNPEFREFYVASLRKEINSTPIDGAVENLNAPRTPTNKKIVGVDEEELRLWCHQYRTLAIADIRRIMSPGQSGQHVADHNKKLFEAGLAAGLIA